MRNLIIIGVVIVIAAAGALFFYSRSQSGAEAVVPTPPPAEAPTPVPPAPPPSEAPAPTPPSPEFPAGVSAARRHLAEYLRIPVEQVVVVDFSERRWPNACLGLGEPGEACAAVVTPGYDVHMSADGLDYRYRTDRSGTIVRAVIQKG